MKTLPSPGPERGLYGGFLAWLVSFCPPSSFPKIKKVFHSLRTDQKAQLEAEISMDPMLS